MHCCQKFRRNLRRQSAEKAAVAKMSGTRWNKTGWAVLHWAAGVTDWLQPNLDWSYDGFSEAWNYTSEWRQTVNIIHTRPGSSSSWALNVQIWLIILQLIPSDSHWHPTTQPWSYFISPYRNGRWFGWILNAHRMREPPERKLKLSSGKHYLPNSDCCFSSKLTKTEKKRQGCQSSTSFIGSHSLNQSRLEPEARGKPEGSHRRGRLSGRAPVSAWECDFYDKSSHVSAGRRRKKIGNFLAPDPKLIIAEKTGQSRSVMMMRCERKREVRDFFFRAKKIICFFLLSQNWFDCRPTIEWINRLEPLGFPSPKILKEQ